jgi:hypothetical protein
MLIPRTPREFVRAVLDLAIVGTTVSAFAGVAVRFFVASATAHEVFVIGFSATMLGCVAVLVLAVVVKVIEIGNRPDAE